MLQLACCIDTVCVCVSCSLTHSVDDRPKFKDLVKHKFIKYIENEDVDVASWYDKVIEMENARGEP